MKVKKEVVFTEKEAIAIAELLETLEGMSGAIDEEGKPTVYYATSKGRKMSNERE